jgi:hypothetical protein
MIFQHTYNWRRQMVWGLMLVAIGLAFFLDEAGILDMGTFWRQYWPLLMVAGGIVRSIGSANGQEFTRGLWSALAGAWLFLSLQGMFGLSLWNSWPVLIIITGITIALRPLAERHLNRPEPGHETR